MLSSMQTTPVAANLSKKPRITWIPSDFKSACGGNVTKADKYLEAGKDSLFRLMDTIPTGNPCLPQLRMHASMGGPKLPTMTGRMVRLDTKVLDFIEATKKLASIL